MFHFGVDLLHSTTEPQHDLPSLASSKGEMASSFSWTSFFKSPTPSTLCFSDLTLAKLNQVKLLCKTDFCITKFYFVWYIQQFIVADTTFSVPRSSSYTNQVSDCHSNLVTTPSSSIDLYFESVPYLSLSFLCRICLILDKLKIEMIKTHCIMLVRMGSIPMEKTCIMLLTMGIISLWRISMEMISTLTTSTSLVVPIRAYKRLSIVAIQSSKIYHAFSNYVKTTFNNGLNLMEVDWGGNIDFNYTSTKKHGPSLMEVDWGGIIDPNHTSSGCMLKQVDSGGNSESMI